MVVHKDFGKISTKGVRLYALTLYECRYQIHVRLARRRVRRILVGAVLCSRLVLMTIRDSSLTVAALTVTILIRTDQFIAVGISQIPTTIGVPVAE